MDVGAAFVADCQATELVEPGEAALDDPAVAAELLGAFDAASGDPWHDVSAPAGITAAAVIVGFVGVQLVGPLPGTSRFAADGGNCIDQRFERHAVVDVGAGQQNGQRDTLPIRREMAFRAGPPAIRGVRTRGVAPFFAAMDDPSTQARLQSIRSASRNRRSNSRCSRSQTPAACQSRNRRQHVTPEPQPSSMGSMAHGMPERSTKRMPVSAARAGTGGRPPCRRIGAGGNSGSMIAHSESDIRGEAIPSHESPYPRRTRVLKRALNRQRNKGYSDHSRQLQTAGGLASR